MEEAEKRVLSQFRTRLANEIVVTGSFLAAFCENSVLDDEMSRLVKSEESYVAKAYKLVELLPKRGPRAFSTFLEILSITNPWIAEKMKSALHEERNKDAKLKINSSVAQSASIEGYCASSLRHVDNDIKATANRFVSSSLLHLTETEQRNVEKWLSEELQRERRRQQYRLPNTIQRHPQDFLSTKEVQTEMTGMEMQELCEDLIVQLHGVDYVKMTADLSFKTLQRQISELLSRVHKMDFLFLECMDKFDDRDRYTHSLPELIDGAIQQQKDLMKALMDSRRNLQRLTEEKEILESHLRRLEEDYEHAVKKQGQAVVHPYQLYLKKRREVQSKYTALSRQPRRPTAGGGGARAAVTEEPQTDLSSAVRSAPTDDTSPTSAEERSGETSPPASPKTRVRFANSVASRAVSAAVSQNRSRAGTARLQRAGSKIASGKLV